VATKQTAKKSNRSTAKKATSSAKRTAKRTTKRTAKTAKRTTKAAKRTVSTAKRTAKTTRPANRRDSSGSGGPGRNSAGRVDALTLLKQDHQEVEALFKRFESAGRNALRRKEDLRDAIIEALSRHAGIEETVFYPAVREQVRGTESTVLESLEEHHVVKLVLREVEDMDPSDERFVAKMTVMMENVRHHVKEEEREMFPKVRRAIPRARLVEIGEALQEANRSAPTRPHPFSPDEPPANGIVEGAVSVMDKARTTGRQAVRRVRGEIHV